MGGGEGGRIQFDPPVVFPKMYLLERERRCKILFVFTFNIIICHIFPDNIIDICQVFQKMKIFSVNINYFYQFFGFFDIFLLQETNGVSI